MAGRDDRPAGCMSRHIQPIAEGAGGTNYTGKLNAASYGTTGIVCNIGSNGEARGMNGGVGEKKGSHDIAIL